MKIEFGVQEYFNELKLMDAQYGQEEELYPWIYMLLQMAECRKKEILKEGYQGVSIRDVHKARYHCSDKVVTKYLFGKKGVPDIVIINVDKTNFLGCIEIKKNNCPLNIFPKNSPLHYDKNNWTNCKIEYNYNIPKMDENKKNEIINGMIDNIKRIVKTEKIEEQSGSKYKKYYFTVSTESKEKITNELDKMNKDQLDMKYEEEWNWSKKYNWYEEEQIISHLEKFKKVLYTNGLEFYFLNLTKDGEEIEVKKLADLTSLYECYQKHKCYIPNDNLLEASAEWDRLIVGLTSIYWHQPPVAEIPSTQTNTQE